MDLGRESAPDATTLLKFRRLLEKHKLTASIFETINKHLVSKGLMMRGGTVMGAAGYNIRWLLRMIRKKGIGLFFLLIQTLGLETCLRVNQSSATIKPLSALLPQSNRVFV
jgi:IS5 family transposase